jgi:hypothetical protein
MKDGKLEAQHPFHKSVIVFILGEDKEKLKEMGWTCVPCNCNHPDRLIAGLHMIETTDIPSEEIPTIKKFLQKMKERETVDPCKKFKYDIAEYIQKVIESLGKAKKPFHESIKDFIRGTDKTALEELDLAPYDLCRIFSGLYLLATTKIPHKEIPAIKKVLQEIYNHKQTGHQMQHYTGITLELL